MRRRYVYDGDQLTAEYDLAGNMLRRYAHGDGADDPLVWYEGSTTALPRYPFADHQGSVVAVIDAAGAMIAVNAYDEYSIPNTTNAGRFQYTGQAWLPELGMYHYKARVYSPTLGRFLQVDPIGYEDLINLYAYVGNDPVNLTDPTGMCASWRGYISPFCRGLAEGIVGSFIPDTPQIDQNGYQRPPELMDSRMQSWMPAPTSRSQARGQLVGSVIGLAAAVRTGRLSNPSAATRIALAPGGRNAGLIAQYAQRTDRQLVRGIQSDRRVISEHQAKIANPSAHMTRDDPTNPVHVARAIRAWEESIDNARSRIDIAQDTIRARSLND